MTDTIQHFINGEFTTGHGAKTFENIDPCDSTLISAVCEATKEDVHDAVMAAKNALCGPWAALSSAERSQKLQQVAQEIRNRFNEFLDAECRDTGKPRGLAADIDIPRGAANFEVFLDLAKNLPTETFETPTPDGTGATNTVSRGPKGVIAAICPWNLPFLLATWKAAPAMACGNSVILKPSEETPATASLLGEVMNKADIPAGVFNVVHGFGPNSTGEFLTRHPNVDAITFTGETCTGEAIMATAAKGIRDVSFELGGKNPAIVFADCHLEKTIEGITRSAFANCGQVCFGTERIYVERSIFDYFVSGLKHSAESLVLGPPSQEKTDMGPLISQNHREKVLRYFGLATKDNATVVTGGGIPEMPGKLSQGNWIEPTIWTGLDDDSVINREEIFGPCCHISPFDNEREVIQRANETDYGLCASIWTQDLERGKRIAATLEVGMAWINSWFLRDLRTPLGGRGTSGIGREGGRYGLDFYTELKNVCVKHD